MRARALLLTEPTREMTRSRRGMRMAKMPAGERTWMFKTAQSWKGPPRYSTNFLRILLIEGRALKKLINIIQPSLSFHRCKNSCSERWSNLGLTARLAELGLKPRSPDSGHLAFSFSYYNIWLPSSQGKGTKLHSRAIWFLPKERESVEQKRKWSSKGGETFVSNYVPSYHWGYLQHR